MKKSARLIKRLVALFLVLLLSIESFGAVVSDNDGSAFITKAEFDSLKNDFQSQIDQYNTSIDAKIDGAIAAYLAGVRLATKTAIEQLGNYSEIRWMHGPYMYYTNRKFTRLAQSGDGNYTDSTGWKLMAPENRRNIIGDAYLWFEDTIDLGFGTNIVSGRIWPTGGLQKNLGFNYGDNINGAGPVLYVPATETEQGWVINTDTPFTAERGFSQNLKANPHSATFAVTFGTNTTPHLPNTNVTNITASNATETGDIIGYRLSNITTTNDSVKGDFTSHIKMSHTPNYPNTNTRDVMWFTSNGSTYYSLRANCGQRGFGWENDYRIDDGLIEDNRWNTETQYNADRENFRYAMYGSDIDIETNFGPNIKSSSRNNYIDLSGSGNSTTYKCDLRNIGITTQCPDSTHVPTHIYDTTNKSTEFTMTIPLWYRQKWGEFLSADFRTSSNKYLKKNAGYPILTSATQSGQLKITIEYEEMSNTDTSVVTLLPDNKIKTYFRNKSWDDGTGEYYKGYKNLNGTGTAVELNGTEWTDGKITVLIDVKKGENVWMRIDPLTSDGVYCTMKKMEVVLETE